jgi:hypothetical protein
MMPMVMRREGIEPPLNLRKVEADKSQMLEGLLRLHPCMLPGQGTE